MKENSGVLVYNLKFLEDFVWSLALSMEGKRVDSKENTNPGHYTVRKR